MKQKSFQVRLQRVMRGGNLTVADLARWLDRPRSTVQFWIDGTQPTGPPLDVEHAHQMLGLLEKMVAGKLGFPLPRMSAGARAKKLAEVRKRVMQQ
jgi:hypothetical protein